MRKVNVKQLSVFIENKAGRVSEITDVLGTHDVNIRGFSVSDTADYGIVRLIVDLPEKGKEALETAGFTVETDHPGGLASVLKVVAEAGVNIEYVYSLISTYVVINVADIDRSLSLLKGQPVELVTQEQIAQI